MKCPHCKKELYIQTGRRAGMTTLFMQAVLTELIEEINAEIENIRTLEGDKLVLFARIRHAQTRRKVLEDCRARLVSPP